MDQQNAVTERQRFDGVGVDSLLRQELSDMADEVGSRNTRVAIAVPVRQIIEIFHRVFDAAAQVPDYDQAAEELRWGGVNSYSPGEVPDPQPEVGVRLDGDEVRVAYDPGYAPELPPATLTLAQAKQFFLAGLSVVAEGERRLAARPVPGITDADADAALAARGIVIGSD